jgi:hypothetical protein
MIEFCYPRAIDREFKSSSNLYSKIVAVEGESGMVPGTNKHGGKLGLGL